jgi:hypothetical protein
MSYGSTRPAGAKAPSGPRLPYSSATVCPDETPSDTLLPATVPAAVITTSGCASSAAGSSYQADASVLSRCAVVEYVPATGTRAGSSP